MKDNEFLWGARERLRIGKGEPVVSFRPDLYAAFSVNAELDDASCLVIAIWLSSRNKEWREKNIQRVREMFGEMDDLEVTMKLIEMMENQ